MPIYITMGKLILWRLKFFLMGGLISFTLLANLAVGRAESVYIHKYQDPQGVWHFSDTLPQTDHALESEEALASAPRQKVRLQREPMGQGQGDRVLGANDYAGPVEVGVEVMAAKNVALEDARGVAVRKVGKLRRYILPPGYSGPLFTIRPQNLRKSWRYKYQYRYVPGDPRAVPDSDVLYRLPFEGGPFPVTQAFHGKASHQDPHNRYAVDIAMPVGTPVACARSGVVMEAMNDYFWSGKDSAYYGPRSNLVRILHDDGSMALYAHLRRGSVAFEPGRRVAAGEIIALSGNTGYSSGPHLHFSVLVNRGMEVVSLPFRFAGVNGEGLNPRTGILLGLPAAGP